MRQSKVKAKKVRVYEVEVYCSNCEYKGKIEILTGRLVSEAQCPDCECKQTLLTKQVSS